jgi:hypothetical protein
LCCYNCDYCHKKYSSKSVLLRHIKDNCKVKKESDEQKENNFKLLSEKDIEINELKKQNKMLMEKIENIISKTMK